MAADKVAGMGRIAVIGAGMGAMAAAARLAVAGHRVVVYERAETYGGAVGRFERDGFAFDTGPALLTLPAVYRDLFVKTGRQPLEESVGLVQVDPSAHHVFADGTRVSLPNASRAGVLSALDEALGAGVGARWGDFLVRAREAWDRARRPLLEEPLWPNWPVLAERDPYPSVPHKKLLRTRRAGTLAEVAAWELRDARLAALLESHALAYGLDPRVTPASAAVLPYMEHAFGTWYVRGGVRELARAVYERCVARRVEFRFGTPVGRIVEKDGRAVGVEVSPDGAGASGPGPGTFEEADFVVAGVAPGALEGLLHGTVIRNGDDVPARSGGASRLTVLLALRGGRPEGTAHRTVVHTADRDGELEAIFGERRVPGGADRRGLAARRPGAGARQRPRGGHADRHGGLGRSGPRGGRGAEFSTPPGGPCRACGTGCCGTRSGHPPMWPGRPVPRGARFPPRPSPRRTGCSCTRRTARGCRGCSRQGVGASRRRSAARGHVGRPGGGTDRGGTGLPGLAVTGAAGTPAGAGFRTGLRARCAGQYRYCSSYPVLPLPPPLPW